MLSFVNTLTKNSHFLCLFFESLSFALELLSFQFTLKSLRLNVVIHHCYTCYIFTCQVLNLGDTLLRTAGAQLITEALGEGHVCLRDLAMDSNEIRREGGVAVAKMVASKPNITSLALDANQFGEAGCEEIYKILEESGKSEIMEPFEDDEEPDEDEDEGVRNKQ